MKNKLKLILKTELYKSGNKIYIKKSNEGKFTDYCGGNVTDECILKGKNSPNPKIRKRATFAANARKWKHEHGGRLLPKWAGGAEAMSSMASMYLKTADAAKKQAELDLKKLLQAQQEQAAKVNKASSIGSVIGNVAGKIVGQTTQNALNKKLEKVNNAFSDEDAVTFSKLTTDDDRHKFLKDRNIKSNIFNRSSIYDSINNRAKTLQDKQEDVTPPITEEPVVKTDATPIQDPSTDPSLTLGDQTIPDANSDTNPKAARILELQSKQAQGIITYAEGLELAQLTQSLKRGGKLLSKHSTHGQLSVLDDTGKVNRNTLKLIKRGK